MDNTALTPSEAIFGFMAWLTTRPATLLIGAPHDAAQVPVLVEAFCKAQGLPMPTDSYAAKLKPVTTEPFPNAPTFDEVWEEGKQHLLAVLPQGIAKIYHKEFDAAVAKHMKPGEPIAQILRNIAADLFPETHEIIEQA